MSEGLSQEQIDKLTLTAFIQHMQADGVWPCWCDLGVAPKRLTADEIFRLRDEFLEQAHYREKLA
jgi:hypothetical protein